MMLDRVVEACRVAVKNIEKGGNRCSVAVVTPTDDPIVKEFSPRVEIVEGPEADVLERYRIAVEKYDPDILIRVTGDCPLLPGAMIGHMFNLAVNKGYDYICNCDERFRTSIDGADVEVMTKRAFAYLVECAKEPYDREHVTPLMRRTPPVWARMGFVYNHFDLSSIKLSVDTREDLENVRRHFETSYTKFQEAQRVYGRGAVHRV